MYKRKIGLTKQVCGNKIYLRAYSPTHPYKDKRNRVSIHRLIIELYYSIKYNTIIYLSPKLHIHHINGNTQDNRIENLEVLTKSQHSRIHYKDNKFPKKDMNGRHCLLCKTTKTLFTNRGHELWYNLKDNFLCNRCYIKKSRNKLCLIEVIA